MQREAVAVDQDLALDVHLADAGERHLRDHADVDVVGGDDQLELAVDHDEVARPSRCGRRASGAGR